MSRGVSSDRIMTSGLGEGYPVASNDTSAGMQQNRRVEIVISDEDGDFPPSAIRRPVARR
jgi:outer membrane protein OmpA-like peptidoglycan-associated protein